jgi:hypothetical protein
MGHLETALQQQLGVLEDLKAKSKILFYLKLLNNIFI